MAPEAALAGFVLLVLAVAVSASIISNVKKSLKEKEALLAQLKGRFAPVINVEAEVIDREQEKSA